MTNKAMFLMAPGLVELNEIELAPIAANEVLVKSEFSAISAGTELANFNDLPNTVRRYPRSFGYNAVGTVVEVGEAVKGYAVGDKVCCGFEGDFNRQSTVHGLTAGLRCIKAVDGEVLSDTVAQVCTAAS